MSTQAPEEREHEYDIFQPGDEIPWAEDVAKITERRATEEIPDAVPDTMRPSGFHATVLPDDARYVIVTVERPDGETCPATATALARSVKENFDKHGLPSVRSRTLGFGDNADTVGVQTPAVGMNEIPRDDVGDLADHLREHKDFEPLYALLGGVDGPEDMERVADALDRAVLANTLLARTDE